MYKFTKPKHGLNLAISKSFLKHDALNVRIEWNDILDKTKEQVQVRMQRAECRNKDCLSWYHSDTSLVFTPPRHRSRGVIFFRVTISSESRNITHWRAVDNEGNVIDKQKLLLELIVEMVSHSSEVIAYFVAGNQLRVLLAILTNVNITGTSTSTPTTVANATPDFRPKREIATATASSKKFLAPIIPAGAATSWGILHHFAQP